MAKLEKTKIDYLWQDRKRIMRLPLSFTKYKLAADRLFVETGLLNTKYEDVVLYRVLDIGLSRSLWQKIFGMGTVTVKSSDNTCPVLVIKNVINSFEVKELLHKTVEEIKKERRIRVSEVMGDIEDADGDGVPDILDADA